MNDVETAKETGFKVHKLPKGLLEQTKITKQIWNWKIKEEYPIRHNI